MKEFRGKVAVVTGAASGIGRGMAERFAAEGMHVVLADVEEGALAQAAREMAAAGAKVLAFRTDVSKAEDVQALAKKAVDAFGEVHVLCNNAGVATGGFSWEVSLAEWQWVLGVNLWGVIHGVHAFVPIMLAQGNEGHIVNTASVAGLTSGPMMAPYSVSKHGVVTLSEALYHELAMAGGKIKVSVLCPGAVNTRIADAGRNRPAEVAAGEPAAPPDAAIAAQVDSRIRQMLAAGMDPAEVGRKVFEAVRDERFYILTHPEYTDAVRTRMEDIIEGRAPTLGMMA
jgi:NAD(P)-dependent dehydrogenase (short-subunit alcohol dehydrogenase family)